VSRSKWLLPPALALALTVTPCVQARAMKPPPAPKIVGIVPGTFIRAIASDGTIYEVSQLYPAPQCGQALTGAVIVGHLFPSPPVSPISATMETGAGLVATLENGDVWILNESCCTSCYQMGTYMGNVFTVAGTSLGTAPSSTNFSPLQPATNPTTKDVRPGARHPKTDTPVAPGAVE
jgi:hypothetical protein